MSGLGEGTLPGSRHGGSGTWFTGCLRFFRHLGHHPRHSAGIHPSLTDGTVSETE